MLIYVIKKSGVFEPVADSNENGIYIPHWDTKKVVDAEEEGQQYREAGAILAHVSYDTYQALKQSLEEILVRIADVKKSLENLNPYAQQRSLENFMADNADTLQHAGNAFLIKNEEGSLVVVDVDTAHHLMDQYKKNKETQDANLYDWPEDEDDDYQEDDHWLPFMDGDDDYYGGGVC